MKERFPQSLVFDFLNTDLVFEFSKRPALLREQLLAKDLKALKAPIILDEVQKVPHILDEVHGLIENQGLHFILMEVRAHQSLRELDYPIHFWRTKSGLEVDFVLGNGEVAIEVKGSNHVDRKDLRPLLTFQDEYAPRAALVVCNERIARVHERIRILPWRIFLQELWEGKIIG